MKNDLLLEKALDRILELEDSWQEKRKHTRIIVGHTYAQTLRIIRERGGKEVNEDLDLMLIDMPLELRKFIDTYYPTICLPVADIVIGKDFDFGKLFRLERIKRKKGLRQFGKLRSSAHRAEKTNTKFMLTTFVKLLGRIGFKVVLEEIPTHRTS